jgi:pimeloyl-ACP methyl ester carboxylesterase
MFCRLWLLLIGVIFVSTSSPLGQAGENSNNRKLIRLEGGRCISIREYGNPSGKPVLYFHGILSSSVEPAYIADEIRQSGLRFIAIDRPGIGGSTYYADRTITDWVKDIEKITHHLGLDKFGIIAVSCGAPYGCVCALKIPHRISHLAIVSGYGPFDVEGIQPGKMDQQIRLISRRPKIGEVLLEMKRRQIHRNPKKVVKWVTSQSIDADRDMIFESEEIYQVLVDNLKETMIQGPDGTITEIDLLRNEWGFELNQIKGVPVSIWIGSADPITNVSMATHFHQQIRGSILVKAPNQGHATMLKEYSPQILRQF